MAFLLARDPVAITQQPLVIVVGQAMMLKTGTMSSNNETNSLIITGLVLLGATDLVQLGVKNWKYFEGVLPLRLVISFALGAWVYYKPSSILHNDLAFIFLFVEMWFHFVLYNFVRQEKDERKKRFEERLEQELLKAQQDGVDVDTLAKKLQKELPEHMLP